MELNTKHQEIENNIVILRRLLLKITISCLLLFSINTTEAQIGIGTNNPDPSAALHVYDTARGLLIPRLTALQRAAIVSPAEGLLIYQTDAIKGYWYFTDGVWRNMAAAMNGGKQTLILADNITNAEAQAKIAAEVGPNTQEIRINRCSNLTTVDLSMVTSLTEIYISGNPVLQSVNLSNLQSIDGGFFIDKCPLLSTLSTNSITKIGQTFNGTYGLEIKNSGVQNLNMPLLTQISGTIYIYNNSALSAISFPQLSDHPLNGSFAFSIQLNTTLSNISLPALNIVGDISMGNNYNLAAVNLSALTSANSLLISNSNVITSIALPVLNSVNIGIIIGGNSLLNTISLPFLSSIGNFNIQNNASLASISFPSLTSISNAQNGSYIINNSNLTSITFNNLATFSNQAFGCQGNKLPSAQVNNLLNKFVSIIPLLTYRDFDFRQTSAAPPTGQGITDKTTLELRPNVVYTD